MGNYDSISFFFFLAFSRFCLYRTAAAAAEEEAPKGATQRTGGDGFDNFFIKRPLKTISLKQKPIRNKSLFVPPFPKMFNLQATFLDLDLFVILENKLAKLFLFVFIPGHFCPSDVTACAQSHVLISRKWRGERKKMNESITLSL